MTEITTIRVQQLDSDGDVYREFTYHVLRTNIQEAIDHIARAYNMTATRVLVDDDGRR
jgi:hypothetical protein